jgi:hypothetical protein
MSTRPLSRRDGPIARIRGLVRAIREGDEAAVERAVVRLSKSRRWLAPLAFAVGALVMLFQGVRLVFTHWRLTLIQILPASWIWLATYDLKAHLLHGRQLNVLRGPILIPVVAAIAAITALCFFLNAVFAFSIEDPSHAIRPAFHRAKQHLAVVLGSGFVVGLALGFATMVASRYGPPWFVLSLGIVIGVMMLCYVLIPSRLIGARPIRSRRDKLIASAVSGTVGAVICTPPYVLGRVGVLMLGIRPLLIPGILVMAVGFALQAGATGAVKAIKMSTKLVAGHPVDEGSGGGVAGQRPGDDRGERTDDEAEQADHADRVSPAGVGDGQPAEAGDQ